ncbi:hypothetical protein ENBRE01_1769 [Enteropsectra breve]|nr:hypothetical protein ENBRE01_1769 [Enteropsectra breve]
MCVDSFVDSEKISLEHYIKASSLVKYPVCIFKHIRPENITMCWDYFTGIMKDEIKELKTHNIKIDTVVLLFNNCKMLLLRSRDMKNLHIVSEATTFLKLHFELSNLEVESIGAMYVFLERLLPIFLAKNSCCNEVEIKVRAARDQGILALLNERMAEVVQKNVLRPKANRWPKRVSLEIGQYRHNLSSNTISLIE